MNIKKIIKNPNKIFLSWIASYALILIIPIIIGSFAYLESIKIINTEVTQANNTSLNQLKIVIDSKLGEIYKISSQITINQNVKNFMYLNHPLNEDDVMAIREVQKDLTKFTVSNSFIDKLYVHIDTNEFIFTGTNKYGKDEYEYLSNNDFGLNASEMMELIHKNQFINYKIVSKNSGDGKVENKVIFFMSINPFDSKFRKGTLIILVDGDKLNQLLENQKWTIEGNIMMVNKDNEFIGTGGVTSLPQFLKYENLNKIKGTFYERFMNTQVAITHTKSDLVDWQYVSVIPSKVFLNKVQYIKTMIYIYVFFCLLIGCFLAYFFSKRNYSPVKKMTELFIDKIGKSEEEGNNGFKYLEASLKSLFDERETFETRLKMQNEAMRNNVFVRVMKGRIKNIFELKETLETYDIRFKSNKFLVIIFSIEQLSDMFFDEKAKESGDTVDLIYFIVKNIVEELISSENHIGYMGEVDGMMVFLVNVCEEIPPAEKPIPIKDQMLAIATRTIEFTERKFGVFLSAVISGEHRDLVGIAKAYSEVLEAVEYRKIIGDDNPILYYSDIHTNDSSCFDGNYSLEKERRFINCIISEDFKSAGLILNDLITKDFIKNSHSLQLTKSRMFGLINSMLNALGVVKTKLDIEFFDELNPANRLLNTKSINELQKQMEYIFEKLTEYYDVKNKEQEPFWLANVEDFVKNHYTEPELSIASISEMLNISASYLSTTFKKHRGTGLLDYIHKVRLEKAKVLMNTDLNIKDIAQQVGYLESKALIRAFKRYEGTTPGKFRENE